MTRPQPPPAGLKKNANSATTTTTIMGTQSSLLKSLASSNQNNNPKSVRLGLQTSSRNQKQEQQQQKGNQLTKTLQPQRQRPQQLSSYNGKDGSQYKDADADERALKKRRLSKPYRSQEDVGDSGSEKDEPQERDRLGELGATVGVRARTRRAVTCNEAADAQDDEGTDTDDFQTRLGPTRSKIRNRWHEYGKGHSSNNNTDTATIYRDLSNIPPYPEHLLSTLPWRPAWSSAQTRGTTNNSSLPNPVTQAPSRKRPLPKVPSHISNTPRAPEMTMKLRKPKLEQQDGEYGPPRPSHSLSAGGPPHGVDAYKAMGDYGTDLWREWCKNMQYNDKDRVTPIKLKDYIDFEVMPKEREMMRKSWRLPGHPGFIAVSGLEAYIRPVVRLWYEQSLETELETIRDAKLRTTRLQQPQQKLDQQQQQQQQPLQPLPPNAQPRQAKLKLKLRQPQLQLPPRAGFVSANQQLMKTIATNTTINCVDGRTEDKENVENEDKEAKRKKEIGEQEKGHAAMDDGIDRANNNYNNNSDDGAGVSGDHIVSDSSETNGKDPMNKGDDHDAATERVPVATSKSVASSTSTLPSVSPLSVLASRPNIPSQTLPSVGKSQIRAKHIQLLKMLDFASPRIDLGLSDRVIKYRLHPRVTTIADVLTEWAIGIEGGPSIQQLNSDYGLSWQHSDEEKEYSDREAIVREFKRLVFEDGKPDQKAQKSLEDELASSSKANLVARLRNS
ncbi:hypothetical protein BG015_001965 [Linnemannia schmuckeri]|uniref:Transcription activator GCR1-like domain-containing protein n=1 Tax=Linnemannia schmuckeri TaxID=64567 RepID=A0A9P5RP32_9FUNG|nr:hypothetical protein BG015_001965 [Linnemannia schmuckeri]